MRFSQTQYENYLARRGGPCPQEVSPGTNGPKIDLDAKPTSLEVAEEETLTVMHAVKLCGGLITGMTRGRANGHWHLSIIWPEHENNTIV